MLRSPESAMTHETGRRRLHHFFKWAALVVIFAALFYAVGFYFAALVAVLMVAIFLDLDSRPFYVAALTLLIISAVFAALSYDSATDWLAVRLTVVTSVTSVTCVATGVASNVRLSKPPEPRTKPRTSRKSNAS